MKYLQKFNNHDDYSNESSSIPTPGVAWDNVHVHYLPKLDNKIVCTYNVTSTTSATQILNKNYDLSNIGSMKVDGVDTTVAYSYIFSTTGKHTVKYTLNEGVTSIGGYMFSDCTNLTDVTIGNSITSIGEHTFAGCTNLTDVTIGNSVTSIGNYAFNNCTNLTSITMPDSVTSIGGFICYGCTALTSVTISKKLTSIVDASFRNCSSLTNITISNAVTNIGVEAFAGCTSMNSIAYTGNISDWKKITKGNRWHDSVAASTVTCSDGTCGLDDQ